MKNSKPECIFERTLQPYRRCRAGKQVRERRLYKQQSIAVITRPRQTMLFTSNVVRNVMPRGARSLVTIKPLSKPNESRNTINSGQKISPEQQKQKPIEKRNYKQRNSNISDAIVSRTKNSPYLNIIDPAVYSNGTVNNSKNKSNSRLIVVHVNIRSLRNTTHLVQLREFAESNKPDVLTISESWLNTTITNCEIRIDGYELFRLDRLYKTGGGVCVLTFARTLKHLR